MLDGVVPVVSAVSVGAVAVAMLGILVNGKMPDQSDWIEAWLFVLLGLGLGRITLTLSPALRAPPHGWSASPS